MNGGSQNLLAAEKTNVSSLPFKTVIHVELEGVYKKKHACDKSRSKEEASNKRSTCLCNSFENSR